MNTNSAIIALLFTYARQKRADPKPGKTSDKNRSCCASGFIAGRSTGERSIYGTKKLGRIYGHVEFSGGGVDDGENEQEAAARELFEEAGVHIATDQLQFFRSTQSSTIREKEGKYVQYEYRMKVYTVNAQNVYPYNASPDEHSEMRWIPISEALAMHKKAVQAEIATGVARPADKIPGAIAPKALETLQILAKRK